MKQWNKPPEMDVLLSIPPRDPMKPNFPAVKLNKVTILEA